MLRTTIQQLKSNIGWRRLCSKSSFININTNENEVIKQPQMESNTSLKKVVPVFKQASIYSERIALKDAYGKYSYNSLARGSSKVAKLITDALQDSVGERVVFLCPNDGYYVITQWGIWASGQIAVPLSPLHPAEMIQYYAEDCKANLLVTTPKYAQLMDTVATKLQKKLIVIDDSIRRQAMYNPDNVMDQEAPLGQPLDFYENRAALIVYTSGTTGKPKGVVLTHSNLQAQISALVKAWRWTSNDCILHTLPLHHIHGIVNVLMCPLYVGAKCIMLRKFEPRDVWTNMLGINVRLEDRINLYMAVPTIYVKLIQEYETIFATDTKMVDYVKQTLSSKVRLMVSGSAPLPTPIFNRWYEISGHKLLERYGMSETGMTLSNLYNEKSCKLIYSIPKLSEGIKNDDIVEKLEDVSEDRIQSQTLSLQSSIVSAPAIREPGYVGLPLPGVKIQLAEKLHGNDYRPILECSGGSYDDPQVDFHFYDDQLIKYLQFTDDSITEGQEQSKDTINEENYPTGEILVKGDTVFKEYYGKHLQTLMEFTENGWFKTGDSAIYDPRKKLFKLLGRTSVDIIKSGGYKISSLHIETVLLEHPKVQEVAVVALPDLMYGEKVAAIIALKDDEKVVPSGFTNWMKGRLPEYSIPRVIRIVDSLARNAMGKVNKKELTKTVFGETVHKNNTDIPKSNE